MLPEVARALGLPDGVRVVAGTPDLHSGAVGAGTVLDYETHLAISTTSWIGCSVPFKKTDVLHQIATVPGLTPDRYLVANNHETGGACLQWLREQVIAPDDGLGPVDAPAYTALTHAAASVAPGADDVLFTPWLSGERSPVDDRYARGGFHNLSLATTRSHLVRAVLEGVAYNSRWLHDAVEQFTKRRLDHLRFIGGGAQSDLWCQIHADVLDRTIERVADPVDANLPRRGAPRRARARRGAPGRGAGPGGGGRDLPTGPRQPEDLRPPLRRVPQALQGPEVDVPAAEPAAVSYEAVPTSDRVTRAATFFSRSM